jgi:hypothetical protein
MDPQYTYFVWFRASRAMRYHATLWEAYVDHLDREIDRG